MECVSSGESDLVVAGRGRSQGAGPANSEVLRQGGAGAILPIKIDAWIGSPYDRSAFWTCSLEIFGSEPRLARIVFQ